MRTPVVYTSHLITMKGTNIEHRGTERERRVVYATLAYVESNQNYFTLLSRINLLLTSRWYSNNTNKGDHQMRSKSDVEALIEIYSNDLAELKRLRQTKRVKFCILDLERMIIKLNEELTLL